MGGMDGWDTGVEGRARGKEMGSGFFFLFLFYIHDYMI